MKAIKITYWITTILMSLMMTMSGIMQLSQQPEMLESLKHLGYAPQITLLLGSFKLLGAVALVFPGYPKIREWAYAGFSFLFIGATYSHFAVADYQLTTLILLAVLLTSYFLGRRIQQAKAVSMA